MALLAAILAPFTRFFLLVPAILALSLSLVGYPKTGYIG
jgi:hypothetical protein